ncbi:protein FAM136A-like isoform X1 [Juglans microcarpa x Juglans regia]|uniref:protein FAM136A-like isoform X1 n=1 Tax=Juglans microcarpa x Juglans regia TaxID=2249226 RepID=UPI001B7E903A|nr:protein FAM136A-like isoform X1 [Juglans microcarpa x Juglans regia]
MDRMAAAEERIVTEKIRQKLHQVNLAAEEHFSPVQDHVKFTLQQAYFKCAYECFDRERSYDEISDCVENCSVPVDRSQHMLEDEMANFQETMKRSLMVCQDKFEAAKLQKKPDALNDLETCVDQSTQDGIKMLPHLAAKLKAAFFSQ